MQIPKVVFILPLTTIYQQKYVTIPPIFRIEKLFSLFYHKGPSPATSFSPDPVCGIAAILFSVSILTAEHMLWESMVGYR